MADTTIATSPAVIQWIVDTRNLWPEVTETRQLEAFSSSSRALTLLPEAERAAVLKYVFARDAKMSLASHLLKHYVVARAARVPWQDTRLTRDARTKPVFVDPATGAQPVAFNVSHQAGVVALVAVSSDGGAVDVDVGVDVVCTSERRARDHAMVAADGWPCFVDMHADVFAPAEARYLKHAVLVGAGLRPGTTPEEVTDYKLRCFYTLWCLREAYVKMTGDALLASWLRELEFRGFRPPPPPGDGDLDGDGLAGGERATEYEIWLKGAKVDDAQVCMRSLGRDYMVCTAVRTPGRREDGLGLEIGEFVGVSVDEIVEFAHLQRV